ncbi:helix-turn-helix transcriptional regulator [Ruegeria sp. ANG-R]|uniref:XRE family transcriptional regulator n=1 Tax=Ruegeria sp. ANG-R TaxID=1577903 RepID=UPI00187CFE53|nr:helix-turn-helix transcriptional regulator [Ruegeria sp. ANG-R]
MALSFQERVSRVIDLAGGPSATSDATGLSRRVIDKYRNGDSDPSRERLVALAKAGGVDIGWLASGEGEMCQETVQLTLPNLLQMPRYPVSASAGHGRFLHDAKIMDYVPFPADFFTTHVKGNPEDMFIINASGDSMEPTMRDGDMIMIDRSAAVKPINAGIYCFTLGDLNFVKRLQQLPDGILARSDNREYTEFMIKPDQRDEFHPVGRVVWIGRSL